MASRRSLFAWAALTAAVVAGGGCSGPGESQAGSPTVRTIDLGASAPVWRSAGAAAGGLAVVWGGVTGRAESPTATATGWIVSAKTGASAIPTAEPPISARSGHIAVSHSGRVLFWGGVGTNGVHLKDGAILDPQSNTWQKMPDAPFGIESPKVIVDGDFVLMGAGRRESNKFNTSILEYHVPSATWRVLDHGASGVTTWALAGNSIVTVSRQAKGGGLTLNWFDRDGRSIGQPAQVDSKLAATRYLGITAQGQHAVIAASTREKTEVFQVSSTGEVLRQAELDGAIFSPAMSTASGVSADDTQRQGDAWISLAEWEIQTISLSDLTGRGAWHLPTCRTESAWIALEGRTFLRYGGTKCGGDVPPDDGTPMQLVQLP